MTPIQLFIGGVAPLPPDGRPSAIVKTAVAGPLAVGHEGLAGDRQADRRVHGGPEKAIHHYAAENHARLAARFRDIGDRFGPGTIGENVSTLGWTEDTVCIGDRFRLGTAVVEVSQPRSPCWKIDARYGAEGLTRWIAETGITGWYYRVVAAGVVATGDAFELLARNADPVSIAEFWRDWLLHRPDPDRLERMRQTPGLVDAWRRKIAERLDWLRAAAPGPGDREASR